MRKGATISLLQTATKLGQLFKAAEESSQPRSFLGGFHQPGSGFTRPGSLL